MDFIDQLKQFAKRVDSLKGNIQTEEATKTSIIMPFFSMLGYDVFNPQEFMPEFTADVGIKKGEKVDYAILQNDNPVILIEAKSIDQDLEKHDSQLFRYFGTTTAKFAILTNGLIYRFYTDLESPNKMDDTPFLEINILDIKESLIPELKKFHKANFNVTEILDTASELKYASEIKKIMASELMNPTDDFIRFFLQSVYSGRTTQSVLEKFRPIIKKSINQYINELMNDKIKSALDSNSSQEPDKPLPAAEKNESEAEPKSKTVTTQEELEAYILTKNVLKDIVSPDDITYKDTINYFNILYQGSTRKWICRLVLNASQKTLILPEEDGDNKIPLESIYDIDLHAEKLKAILQKYLCS